MPAAFDAALERAHPDAGARGDPRERIGDRDGVAVVAHHQHRHPFPAEGVVHPADREGRNPTHTLLLENAGNAGRYIDRHGCGLLGMEPSPQPPCRRTEAYNDRPRAGRMCPTGRFVSTIPVQATTLSTASFP